MPETGSSTSSTSKSKAKPIEEVGVADRMVALEAHPSQTDHTKPAPDEPVLEEVTGQQVDKAADKDA